MTASLSRSPRPRGPAYAELPLVSEGYPPPRGRLPTCSSPVRRVTTRRPPARLACIRHAASVDPEPGSNSPPWRSLPPVSTPSRARHRSLPVVTSVASAATPCLHDAASSRPTLSSLAGVPRHRPARSRSRPAAPDTPALALSSVRPATPPARPAAPPAHPRPLTGPRVTVQSRRTPRGAARVTSLSTSRVGRASGPTGPIFVPFPAPHF